MGSYEGVGARIRERLVALGYQRDDGEPDIQRFGWDHRFDKGHLYSWLRDEMTPFKDLTRLCDALECSERWLLMGAERKRSSGRPRRGARHLVLVVSLGAASALLTPSVPPIAQTLPSAVAALHAPSYRKWRSAAA